MLGQHADRRRDTCGNRLISALPRQEFVELRPHLRSVPLVASQILHRRGEAVRNVYFPAGGACSLLMANDGPSTGEIAGIGNEGVVGANVFFGERVAAGDTLVSVGESDTYVMNVDAFNNAMCQRRGFHNLVVRYSQAVIGQIMQLTVCHRLHPADARASRWLLNVRDRLGRDELPLTYAMFAHVLGVTPPTLARTVAALVRAGGISYGNGRVRVVDPAVLQSTSCECYTDIHAMFGRLLPELVIGKSTHDPLSQHGNLRG